eukprot:11833206-Ditylum_brightwellii.AAC.1
MYIKSVIRCIHTDLRAVLVGDRLSLSHGTLCMHSVAGQDPLGNHIGLPRSIPVGDASDVVPVGYNDGLPFGIIAG